MKKSHLVFLTFCFSVCLSACSSGPRLVDQNGNALSGIAIQLEAINDQGEILSIVNTTITDGDGHFESISNSSFSSAFILRALIPSGPLRSFATFHEGPFDYLSEALVELVLAITETDNGRTLPDFSASELRSINAAARTRLKGSDTKILSVEEAKDFLRSEIGRRLADASGGEVSTRSLDGLVAPDVLTNDVVTQTTPQCGKDHILVEGQFFQFDFLLDGALCNINALSGPVGDALDVGPALSLGGDTFSGHPAFPGDPDDRNPLAPIPPTLREDARELRFGPVVTDSGNLSVTRKAFVLENRDWVRYLEIIENISKSEQTVDVRIEGEIGYGTPFAARVLTSENDPNQITSESHFGGIMPQFINTAFPSLGFVFDGFLGFDQIDFASFPPDFVSVDGCESPDECFTFIWEDVTIPAGKIRVLSHFFFVTSSQNESFMYENLEALAHSPDFEGLSAEELISLVNFYPDRGNIIGEAGSVVGLENLTIQTTNENRIQIQALADGSFMATLNFEQASTIQIVGDLGTSLSVQIENE